MTATINQATVKLVETDGRGRSIVAAAPLMGGQAILRDSPILLYSALPFLPPPSGGPNLGNTYCTQCFKLVSSTQSTIPCPSCFTSIFCSPNCLSLSRSSLHTPLVCQSIQKLQASTTSSPFLELNVELQVQARFLIAAYNLSQVCSSDFQTLMSLQGASSDFLSSPESTDTVVFLHSLVSSFLPPGSGFTGELVASLLAKDKINAFGIMESSEPGKERSVRAYGIYPLGSLFNHDCLPNACRFDYFDGGNGMVDRSNTDIVVRMIHDVPEGREICLSYFPVNLKYSERQKRLTEDYGFVCDCDRCEVEANWSDQEGEGSDEEDETNGVEEAAMSEDEDEGMEEGVDDEGSSAQQDDFPHAYFFLKYMCTKENCWGTLAPITPTGSETTALKECNVCGFLNDS